jgi:hypothetical protein
MSNRRAARKMIRCVRSAQPIPYGECGVPGRKRQTNQYGTDETDHEIMKTKPHARIVLYRGLFFAGPNGQ